MLLPLRFSSCRLGLPGVPVWFASDGAVALALMMLRLPLPWIGPVICTLRLVAPKKSPRRILELAVTEICPPYVSLVALSLEIVPPLSVTLCPSVTPLLAHSPPALIVMGTVIAPMLVAALDSTKPSLMNQP